MPKRKSNLIPYRITNGNLEFYLSHRSLSAMQYPNLWSFWGGGIEGDETTEQAMLREIKEELTWTPTNHQFLGVFYDSMLNEKNIYYTKVTSDFENVIEIRESQGGKFFTKDEIESESKMTPEDKKVIFELFDILNNMETKLKEIGNEKKCPIAIMVKNEKVLVGHRNYTKDKWKDISVWTVPGGRCDTGEKLEDTLRREVLEEVGITDFKIVDYIGEVDGAKEGDIVSIFFCTTEQDCKLMEPEKFSEWRWVPKDEYIAGGQYAGFNLKARKIIVEYLQKNL